ncbi:MAG: site-2 protease family protein [Anaerolineales bacterium]|jgi:Zn-dependent protease
MNMETQVEIVPTEEKNADLTRLVSRVFSIDEITWGTNQQNYIVRYRGHLNMDSTQAYDELAGLLRVREITPIFRIEEGRQTIVLMPFVINPKPSNAWINLILFVLTMVSMVFAGFLYSFDGNGIAPGVGGIIQAFLENWTVGLSFAISLLAILLAHEFGHYLAGRYHKTHVTLPYFIPLPISLFGTLGAFIQLKEPPKNKRILLDIGIAGPLAGLVVAIPVLLIGLSLSTVNPLPHFMPQGSSISVEGNSLLYLFAKYLTFGQLLPEPSSYNGLSPLLYWIRYFFTGRPYPLGGTDVFLHPMAWAGWAGLLVTALNLIPVGQLDGGHVSYVLLGNKARLLVAPILVGLVLLGLAWSGWWLWAFLLFFLGRYYAEPLDQITPLDPKRKAVAILGLVIFFLVFIPVPLIFIS